MITAFVAAAGLGAIIVTVVMVLTGSHGAAQHSTASHTDATFRVLDPQDGTLTVGGTVVHQLTGRCPQKGVCEYTAPAKLPVVAVARGVGSIPLKDGVSTSWSTSVTPLSAHIDATKVRLAATGGRLLLSHVPAGTYRLSLKGVHDGAWQFDLKVLSSRQ